MTWRPVPPLPSRITRGCRAVKTEDLRPMGTGDVNPLLRTSRFLRRNADTSSGGWSALTPGQRGAQSFYRDRWQRDKVVRSTPGVNCTGSCSWKVYVKDGIITRETQQTDYPSNGPDMPDTRRAAVRAVLRSPGIRTHRCASATPTLGASCWSSTVRPDTAISDVWLRSCSARGHDARHRCAGWFRRVAAVFRDRSQDDQRTGSQPG
jgi:hypothetical protein